MFVDAEHHRAEEFIVRPRIPVSDKKRFLRALLPRHFHSVDRICIQLRDRLQQQHLSLSLCPTQTTNVVVCLPLLELEDSQSVGAGITDEQQGRMECAAHTGSSSFDFSRSCQ